MNTHSKPCIAVLEDERDYVFGSASGLVFKAVKDDGDWSMYLDFFERQKFSWETDGCVLFTAQESFDAQINHLIETGQFPQPTIDFFYSNGYMETSTIDNNQPRFHTSPRFLHVLAGTKHNGTALQKPWDVMRHSGALPWTDLPFDENTTEKNYFAPIAQAQLDKAVKLLAYISISYQWIAKGGRGTPISKMALARKQSPLCCGTDTCSDWNSEQPPACPSIIPEHSWLDFKGDAAFEFCFDHYQPFIKRITHAYNIPFVFQGIVSIVPQSPSPLPPAPILSTPATPEQKFSLLQWFGIVGQYLRNVFSATPKGRNPTSITIMPTKSWFQSKTLWFNALTIVIAVATYFGFTPNQELATNVTNFLIAMSPVVNIGLRLITKQPIATPATP